MGSTFFDQYSLLHFAVGVVSYFWSVSFWWTNAIHILFEIIENTTLGIYVIDSYLWLWPGGKLRPDDLINRTGDVAFGALGWLASYHLDQYFRHLKNDLN